MSAHDPLDDELIHQLHPTRNGSFSPEEVVKHPASSKWWWKCPAGPDHSWRASLGDRRRGRGCPYCRAIPKVSTTSSLARVGAIELSQTWHPTRNEGARPSAITAKSGQPRWWKCSNGPDHIWPASPGDRNRSPGKCPYCNKGSEPSVTNSVAAEPSLRREWHPLRNGDLQAHQVRRTSPQSAWWKCPAGPDHEWRMVIGKRWSAEDKGPGNRPQGCPTCAKPSKAVSVTTSLARQRPSIAAQWHPLRNGAVEPHQAVLGRNNRRKPAWWKCPNHPSHEWTATVLKRALRRESCPFCFDPNRSKDEIYLLFELKHHFVDIDPNETLVESAGERFLVDIVIRPKDSSAIIVEYDGHYHHKGNDEKDREKAQALEQSGFRVIRVREAPLEPTSGFDVVVPAKAPPHVCAKLLLDRLKDLGVEIPRYAERAGSDGPLAAAKADAFYFEFLSSSRERMVDAVASFLEEHPEHAGRDLRRDPIIGKTVIQLLSHRRRDELTEEQAVRLCDRGFLFDAGWEKMYARLLAHREETGDARPDARGRGQKKLANWASKQRSRRANRQMPPWQMRKLDELGFDWDLEAALWEEGFQRYLEQIEITGSPHPSSAERFKSVFNWLQHQRESWRQHTLSADRIDRMLAVGFLFDPSSDFWDARLAELREFHSHHGHCEVPHDYPNKPLVNWVRNARRWEVNGELSAERRAQLDALGFNWQPRENRWLDFLEKLEAHVQQQGSRIVEPRHHPQLAQDLNYHLGRWRRGKLEPERVEALTALGFHRNQAVTKWMERLEELRRFGVQNGHYRVPRTIKLGTWVQIQRRRYREGKMSAEEEGLLRGLAFDLDPQGVRERT
jgi:hypothetical protein